MLVPSLFTSQSDTLRTRINFPDFQHRAALMFKWAVSWTGGQFYLLLATQHDD